MTLPPDLAAFITMILRGSQLTAQSLLVGGLFFLALLARPLAPALQSGGAVLAAAGLWVGRAGLVLAVVAALAVGINIVNLTETLDLPLGEAVGADFIAWTCLAVLGGITAWLWLRTARGRLAGPLLLASVAMVMLASLMSSHAAARLDQRSLFMAADLLHQLGVAVWIGGIPFLLLSLSISSENLDKARIGKRFSQIAIGAVAILALGAGVMAVGYSGSWRAAIGTAYGAMMATKLALLGVLLLMGLLNLLSTRDPGADPKLTRLFGFAEVEIGIGVAVIFVAASLASSPPAIDQALDPGAIASFSEIADRLAPQWPRLIGPSHDLITIPAPDVLAYSSSDADKAWSEVNHHWAGIFLLVISLLAIADCAGIAPWARQWPLLFLVMAVMLFIRSDPESWPLGPLPFWERFLDPETMQHRMVMMLLVPFGLFEWAIRTGRLTANWARLVFPSLCALGGTLLLAHTHSLIDVKQSYLIEITHLPMGALGILAGWARWLELRGTGWQSRLGRWVWPICFTLIALLLIDYREI
jgi:putative copper resistance protein D